MFECCMDITTQKLIDDWGIKHNALLQRGWQQIIAETKFNKKIQTIFSFSKKPTFRPIMTTIRQCLLALTV